MVILFLSITPFEFILSAIPVAILFILVLIYIISAYWREDARARVKEFSKNLRENQHFINLSEQRQKVYVQIRTQGPFANPYERTSAALAAGKTANNELYQRYSHLQQEIADQMVNTFRNMLMAPYLWFETRRKQQRFERDLVHHEHLKTELENALFELDHVGPGTAMSARSAWQQVQELGNILQTLSQRQIHGENFTRVRERYGFIYSRLSQMPAQFLNYDPANPSDTFNNHGEVVKVAAVLDQHSAELAALFHNCQNWEAQHNLVHEQLHQLNERQGEIAGRLGLLPMGIDSAPLLQILNESRVQIRSIRERARRTEADELRLLLRETRQTARILETLLKEINQLIKVFDGYQQARSQVDAEWQQLKGLAYRLSQSPFLPIQLDQSGASLNAIHKEINTLPPLNTPMTPESLRHSFSNLQTLLKTCQMYAPGIEILQNNHAELMVLLKRLKTDEINQWADEIQKNHQQTSLYHTDNYYQSPALVNLDVPGEIQKIKNLAAQLPSLTVGVKESELNRLLVEARDMESRRKLLDEAYQDRSQQFQTLQASENTIREQLEVLGRALDLLHQVIEDEPYLQQKALRSLRAYGKRHEALLKDIDHSKEGLLTQKKQNGEILEKEIRKDLDIWQEDLNRRSREGNQETSSILGQIKQLAVLDESILAEAEASVQNSGINRSPKGGDDDIFESVKNLEQLQTQLGEFAAILDEIQALHAEVKPVHDELNQAAQRCRQKVEATARWIDPSGWNQRALAFDRLRKDLDSVQNDVKQWQQTSVDLDGYLKKASLLTGRFKDIMNRIEQINAEGEQERKAVQDAENTLNTTIDGWKKLAEQHSQDREIRFGVQALLQQYQQQFGQEQKKYERGTVPLEGYLRALKQIDRRLNAESVPTAEEKQIDITGRSFR